MAFGDRLYDCKSEPTAFDVRRRRAEEPLEEMRQLAFLDSATGIRYLDDCRFAVTADGYIGRPPVGI